MFSGFRSAALWQAPATLASTFFAALMTVSGPAFAQQGAAPGGPPAFLQLVPMIVIFAGLMFIMNRANSKRQKQQQEFLSKLKRGDTVLTASGLFGTIEGITEQFVTLEIANGVRVKMLKSQVATFANEVKA